MKGMQLMFLWVFKLFNDLSNTTACIASTATPKIFRIYPNPYSVSSATVLGRVSSSTYTSKQRAHHSCARALKNSQPCILCNKQLCISTAEPPTKPCMQTFAVHCLLQQHLREQSCPNLDMELRSLRLKAVI